MLQLKVFNRKEHEEKTRKERREDIPFAHFAKDFATFAVKKHLCNINLL
jgi:hypothetical protein